MSGSGIGRGRTLGIPFVAISARDGVGVGVGVGMGTGEKATGIGSPSGGVPVRFGMDSLLVGGRRHRESPTSDRKPGGRNRLPIAQTTKVLLSPF